MALIYGKFDAEAYGREYAIAPSDAIQHWVNNGFDRYRRAFIVGFPESGLFDPTGYLNCNPDLRQKRIYPFNYFRIQGYLENRPIALFVDTETDETGTWLHLAREGETSFVKGDLPRTVRYGAGTKWVLKDLKGLVKCESATFQDIDPLFGIKKTCQLRVSGPDSGLTWSCIGLEGHTVTLNGTRIVRYGAGDKWIVRLLTGKIACTSAFFGGDPAHNVVKTCEQLGPEQARGSWQKVCNENERFRIEGLQTLRYGIDDAWIVRSMGGMAVATNDTFGTDPAPGKNKLCEVWVPSLRPAIDRVMNFDGVDDKVTITGPAAISEVGFTVEAWIKPDVMGDRGILKWGELKLKLTADGVAAEWGQRKLSTQTGSLTGRWSLVTVVCAGTCSLYVNGVLKGSETPARTGSSIGTFMNIVTRMGATSGSTTGNAGAGAVIGGAGMGLPFDGCIGEVRVWTKARSADEIRNARMMRLSGTEPGLAAYYPLREHVYHGKAGADLKKATISGPVWVRDDALDFVIEPGRYYRLTNFWRGDGHSLDLPREFQLGVKPFLGPTADLPGQYWRFNPQPDGTFTITCRWFGKQWALAVDRLRAGTDIIAGTALRVKRLPDSEDPATRKYKLWKLELLKSGYFRLVNVGAGDGKCLDIGKGGSRDTPQLTTRGNGSGQFWRLTRTEVLADDADGQRVPEPIAGTAGAILLDDEINLTTFNVASLEQNDPAASGPPTGCSAQAEGCVTQGCATQIQGCAAKGCGAQAEGCAAQGCAAQADGCASQGCGAQTKGCAAQGCAAQADACAAQGCAAQLEACAAQGCAAQATACAAQGCGGKLEGCGAQACAADATACALLGCGAQAAGCAADACVANAAPCATDACGVQAGACAAQGCAGAVSCVVAACPVATDSCAAEGCGGKASLMEITGFASACAAQGCAGNAALLSLKSVPCALDGQVGPCFVDIPYCPLIL